MSTNSLVKVLVFFLHFTRGSLEPSEVQKCLNLKSLGTNHLHVPVFVVVTTCKEPKSILEVNCNLLYSFLVQLVFLFVT